MLPNNISKIKNKIEVENDRLLSCYEEKIKEKGTSPDFPFPWRHTNTRIQEGCEYSACPTNTEYNTTQEKQTHTQNKKRIEKREKTEKDLK